MKDTNTKEMIEIVRAAWSSVAAPPEEDLAWMQWECGTAAELAFTGVAPMDVDVRSGGFATAAPLLYLPPRAAAAYLGTFLISLLQGLDFQEKVGFSDDFLTRPHTLNCLTNENFWHDVIRKELSPACVDAAEQVARLLSTRRNELHLTQEQVDTLLKLSTPSDK